MMNCNEESLGYSAYGIFGASSLDQTRQLQYVSTSRFSVLHKERKKGKKGRYRFRVGISSLGFVRELTSTIPSPGL